MQYGLVIGKKEPTVDVHLDEADYQIDLSQHKKVEHYVKD